MKGLKQHCFVICFFGCLMLEVLSKGRKHGHFMKQANAAKRSKYQKQNIGSSHPIDADETYDSETMNNDIVSNYATENTPVFWRDVYNGHSKPASKKTEEGATEGGFELDPDQLPNTVGPNENIYGGFPVNDVLGGFELPSPETLAILKAALKKHGPRNQYEEQLHHDLENWAYGYEHHALPEYDVKETPPFYVTMLQGLKMAEEGKQKPGCHGGGTCEPMYHLNDDQCNVLAGNCMSPKPVTSGYEEPCPWKIIEMLFGCKKPKNPQVAGKPDGIEPPPPKPDAPEKPAAGKEEKDEGEKGPDGKPKPIPLQLDEGHATPEHVEKQVEDIKDKAKDEKNAPQAGNSRQTPGKLQSQLGLLGILNKLASTKQDPQSRMEFASQAANISTTNEGLSPAGQSVGVKAQDEKPSKALNSKKPEDLPATEFSTWSDWSSCSVTCGNGSLSRTRSCLHWKCDGKVIDIKPCKEQECPGYLQWSPWSTCDTPCGNGRERRTRKCSGIRCSGISKEERSCFRDPCKANLKMAPALSIRLLSAVGAPWSSWSSCTSKCGFGVQTRKRDCKQGNCDVNSDLVQTKICLRQSCSGDTGVSEATQKACLYIHNSYRLAHGAQELKLASNLAEDATKLAQSLAAQSASKESAKALEEPGISIMVLPLGDSSNIGIQAVCYTVAKLWYAEQKNYNFQNPHLTDDNKHFTQMIWKASREVGFGSEMSKNGGFYFVAKYDPPGNQDNYVGFRKNALPLQSNNRLDDAAVVKRLKRNRIKKQI